MDTSDIALKIANVAIYIVTFALLAAMELAGESCDSEPIGSWGDGSKYLN